MRSRSLRSISKHSGALMSSRLMPPKVGSSAATISTSLSGSSLVDLDVEHVDAGELLEQDRLAFHHRLAGERADVAEAEHGGAVGDHGDQVAARGVARRPSPGRRDRLAGRGDAGRIGQRQVALVGQRLGSSTRTPRRNVTGVLFEQLTGRPKVQFIPYRGAGPAMTDLVSGTVDLLVVQGAVALPQVRAGKIKALANLSPQRSASMPDIPTSDETGVPGLYMSGWFGFFAPKGTPKDVIAKLNARWCKRSPIRPCRRSSPSSGSTSPARAADAGGARRVPEGRDREMVADHQGGVKAE
jgi:hypothetical protein